MANLHNISHAMREFKELDCKACDKWDQVIGAQPVTGCRSSLYALDITMHWTSRCMGHHKGAFVPRSGLELCSRAQHCEEAFEDLKLMLTNTPILRRKLFDLHFAHRLVTPRC